MPVEGQTETIPVRAGEGFDHERVMAYLRGQLAGLPDAPLEVRQFPSGASNLTYLLRIGLWEGVLRRAPLGPLPPKAHDMLREANLLRKLHPHFPLAPEPLVICPDETVLGVPFYVMDRRRGVVLNDAFPPGVEPTEERCRRISETTVDTLVELHAIDWEAAGLADLGYPTGFLERQVRGWIGRYEGARTDDIPQVAPLVRWLEEQTPESPAPTIIHNDYKLNNMLLHSADPSRIVAVLDWEMTTIGDPLFDLAISLSYWVGPDDPEELQAVFRTVTVLPGFYSREEFMQRYAVRSGRDLSAMHFQLVFAYFKLAVILQQIYARWKRGHTQDERFAGFGERVRHLIVHAHRMIETGRL